MSNECETMKCKTREGVTTSNAFLYILLMTGQVPRRQVKSGQVRVFNVHIQSQLLYRTPVTGTGTAGSSVRDRGGRGAPALAGTKEYEQSNRNR